MGLLALGLVGGEDPAPAIRIDMAGRDGEDLLGPAAGLPADDQQVPERPVLDLAEDPAYSSDVMTTSRRPARGISTWRTGLASISPMFAARLNARWTAVIAPRSPRPQPVWASTHCWTWNGFSRSTVRSRAIEPANDWR